MDVTVSQAQGRVPVTIFHVAGAVTTNQELEARAQAAYDGGTRNILLDLTEVPYMATAGLRALHAIFTLLRADTPAESDATTKAGIAAGTFVSPHLKLLNPNAYVLEVLKVAGYDMFLEIHHDMNQAVASFRPMDTALLNHVPLFVSLPAGELADMAVSLRETCYSAGTVLFREGDYGDRFYIVLDGCIAIVKALGSDDERLLGLRGAGEFVGEMSLLSQDGLRTASVRVEADARVLELTRADFDALLHRYPLLAYEMLRVLSIRLRESHDTAIRDLHEKNARLAQAYADLQAAQARIIEQETLERELRLARETQESMLPRALPRLPGFDIGARMIAAHMVGGDFYDLFPLGPNRLGVVIGDVSGKGMPAALFMALVSSLLRAEAQRSDTTPEQALRIVNNHLLSRDAHSMFVTVLYGVLCRETREFAFVRAGHEMPLLLAADGALLTPPMGRGHVLGLFPNPMLDLQTVQLPPGGTLLLYTDGVNEAMDANNQLFGSEQIIATVRGAGESSAQQLCDQLVQAVTAYRGLAAQADDITLVAVRAQ